jgi:hypothetical protein
MTKLNSEGFISLVTFLMVMVLVMIGVTGYFVFNAVTRTSGTPGVVNVATPNPATSHKKWTGEQATAFVQNTYNTYLNTVLKSLERNNKDPNNPDSHAVQIDGLAAIKKDLSPDLYQQLYPAKAGEDKVGCALYVVDSYHAFLLRTSNNYAVVANSIVSDSQVNGTITVTVNLLTGKITQIACPLE